MSHRSGVKVLYLHGFGIGPGGYKPRWLREQGFEVVNPGLPTDFASAVEIAQQAFDVSRPHVLVGSSFGGAVALVVKSERTPRVLIAPAWSGSPTLDEGDVVLHSPTDEVIPFAHSQDLVSRSNLPPETLISVGMDHGMADSKALWALANAIDVAAERKTRGAPPPGP